MSTGADTTTNPQVTYARDGDVSTITMDDGKVNVFTLNLLRALHDAFEQAERDGTVVLLTGRPGCFSAGFDLGTLRDDSPEAATELLRLGATMAERILSFPAPVVAACPGHAFPAGAFLLMAADVRFGAEGRFFLGLNEVRIGLTLPWFAVALARHRLTPPAFDRCAVTGTLLDPRAAVTAGLLDAVVAPEELDATARAAAEDLIGIDRSAHAATKLRARQRVLAELREAIDAELG